MAEVRTAINITDGLTPAFKSMTTALGLIIKNFQTLQTATGQKIDTSALVNAKTEIEKANNALTQFRQNAGQAASAQQAMNASMNAGVAPATGLIGKVKELGAAYLGYIGIASAMGFVKEALDLSDTQRNVEQQLAAVLKNVGQTQAAFDELKNYASEIQGKGIYGDEAMIAGAAEFATYMSDKDAIKKMMSTLSNYAMGMTGGGAVDDRQMTQFATQLGMAINGNMAGLSRKGFSMTDEQKEIMKNGTDMQKALVLEEIIGESWDGLYEKMSNTPEGKIIQLNNAIGDMKEVAGDTFYSALAQFADHFTSNLPKIQNVITGITNALSVMVVAIGFGAKIALDFANAIVTNWGWIGPIVLTAAAAWGAYNTALTIAAARTALLNGLAAAKVAWTYLSTGAIAAETIAQYGLNAALMACPLTWIVAGIMAVVGVLYLAVGAWNTFTDDSISATGIIAGTFAVLGAQIWNIIAFLGNAFMGFCEFLNNVFVSPLDAIYNLFVTIWNGVVATVGQAVAEVLRLVSKIPGLGKLGDIGPGSMMLQKRQIEGGVDNSKYELGYKSLNLAAHSGYAWGKSKSEGFSFDPYKTNSDLPTNPDLSKIADNTGETAKGVNGSKEDIKLLREIAERDAINRFTTAEIKVDMTNNNTVNNSMDLDGMASAFGSLLKDQLAVAAEGVHT